MIHLIIWVLARNAHMTLYSNNPSTARFLMCNYTVVRSESGTVHGAAVDLCHHVSSCFSFWGTRKLIRLSCSYNYFCSSPFSVPSLSVMLSASARARLSIPEDMTPQSISGVFTVGGGGWDLSYIQCNFPIQTRELNEILQCYLSGEIGHSSVSSSLLAPQSKVFT